MIAVLHNLEVRYEQREPVVRGISLELSAGSRVGLAGESGCGKTTLLRAIAGLLPESTHVAGSIQATGRIGYIPQEGLNSLSPFLTTGGQIAELSSAANARQLLQLVGLGDPRYYDAYPHQLSGGERQRILIAQALALRPRLILADEPTANVDPDAEALVLDVLDQYLRESGAALLIASHRERVFERLGCKVVRLTPFPDPAPARAAAQEHGKPLLTIRHLSKTYSRRDWLTRTRPALQALQDVSLQISAGECVALTGASGAGKSTLARCIAGRETYDHGSIEWNGAANAHLVDQEPSETLNPRFTIAEAMEEAATGQTPAALRNIGLPPEWWRRKVRDLSEGQRARVAILRTAARRPSMLILDESLAGLDTGTRHAILAYLQKQPLTLLLITHDEDLAREAGARRVHLSGGTISA